MAHHISNFALQYQDVSYAALRASPYDLIVTEGDPIPSGTWHPEISAPHVTALQAQGRTIVGYVETSVVEDYRSYWNPAWTKDGTSTGKLTAVAPDWLKGQPKNSFGYITKFWDPAWQKIVVDQAVWLVQHGYDGVFLDDTGRYWDLIGKSGEPDSHALADDMIDLIARVSKAIKKIDPNAYVVINGDPYIGTYATGGLSGAEEHKFLKSFDKMLLENEDNHVLADAIANIGAAKLLALYSAGSEADKMAAVLHAYQLGVTAYSSPGEGYDSLGAFINPGTNGDDTLTGGDGPNTLAGLAGDDSIASGAGNDVLNGGKGSDTLNGGTGADIFVYASAKDSTGIHFDTVAGFDTNADRFDLPTAVIAIDKTIKHGTLSNAHFTADLETAAASLGGHHAVLFTPDAGNHAGEIFLIVDANGAAGYQDGADLLVRLDSPIHLGALGNADFR